MLIGNGRILWPARPNTLPKKDSDILDVKKLEE
jgi:hypothetical protein